MKRGEPSFEDFIQKKLSEAEYKYQPSYWNAAAEHIANQQEVEKAQRKSKRKWWLLLLLLLGSGGLLFESIFINELEGIPTHDKMEAPRALNETIQHQDISTSFINESQKTVQTKPSSNSTAELQIKTTDVHKNYRVLTTSGEKPVFSSNTLSNTILDEQAPFKKGVLLHSTIAEMDGKSDDKQGVNPLVYLKNNHASKQDAEQLKTSTPLNQIARKELQQVASIHKEIIEMQEPEQAYSRPSRLGLSVESYFSRSLFLSNPLNGTEANIMATYQLTPRWQLSTGLGYTYLNGQLPVGIREQVTFGFVATRTRYEWGLKNIHYLHFPIEGAYLIRSRHKLTLGGDFAYRLKTSGALSVHQKSTVQGDAMIAQSDDIDYGASLAQWNTSISLGYGYQFNSHLQIGLRLRYQLNKMFDADFFKTSTINKPVFGGLYLRYHI